MIRYSNGSRHNTRYVPWHQNVFVWRSVGTGGSAPASTVTPKVWALRGGYGRQSLQGNKGYSK